MTFPVPPEPGTVHVFEAPSSHRPAQKGDTVYVPYQLSSQRVEKKAQDLLNTMRPTGWDWLPESLHHGVIYEVASWCLSSSQREHEVTPMIEAQGLKVVKVTVTDEEFKAREKGIKNITKKPWVGLQDPKDAMFGPSNVTTPGVRPSSPNPTGAPTNPFVYGRTRYLWKNHNSKFSDFERTFVESIGKQLKSGRNLSPKQMNVLVRIFNKYGVPQDATASTEIF